MLLATVLLLVACDSGSEPVWERLESLAVARSEHPAVVWEGSAVAVGGLIVDDSGQVGVTDSVEAMDLVSREWSMLPPLPAPRHHSMVAVAGDRLFVIGGYSAAGFVPVSDVWELEGTGWSERASLPAPVAAGGAAVVDDHVYVIGGAPDGRSFRYDVEMDRWADIPATSTQREHLAVAERSGQIWALGGRWGPVMHDTVEIYDVDENQWVEGPPMREARSGFGAAFDGSVLYVAGGEVFGPDRALRSIESLELEAEAWESAGSLPEPLHGIPLLAVEGELIVIGGSIRPGAVDNPGNVWSIDPTVLIADGR